MAHVDNTRHLLLVEPDTVTRERLADAIRFLAVVDAVGTFEQALACLQGQTYDLLVTNVRLEAYNGLHLVHLLQATEHSTRSVVYTTASDLALARDAQQAGAFFELTDRVPIVLRTYVRATLPPWDRRNAASFDRRQHPRGGRRAWDTHLMSAQSG